MNKKCDAEGAGLLYEMALDVLVKEQAVSVSLLQCRLVLCYTPALHLMGELERNGVVTMPNKDGVRTLMPQFMTVQTKNENESET